MKSKKGFTLIELLAVIVIIVIIALIAIPVITGVIDKAKKGAFKDSVLNAYNTLEYKLSEMKLSEIPEEGISVLDLPLKSTFTSGAFLQDENGKVHASLITDGKFCANGPIDNLTISNSCSGLIDASKVWYEPGEGVDWEAQYVDQALDTLYDTLVK